MKYAFQFLLFVLPLTTFSQTGNIKHTFSGYIETYYCYSAEDPKNHTRPAFVYSHNRHNEVNLNIGFVRVSVSDSGYRANMAIMAGTYANANLAAEPGVLKNIYEGNAGIKLCRKKNIWLDAGVFSSHIGFESAIGKDCWNLTRSLAADNTPYFECGAKLTSTSKNEKWALGLFVLNGWQRIQRLPGNTLPAFGTQLYYKPSDKFVLNSSTFVGTDKPDSSRQMRYFHNFYAILQLTPRFGVVVGVDAGMEQMKKDTSAYNNWINPTLIFRYKFGKKCFVSLRGEYYKDENGVIIFTGTPNGFSTVGYSLNFDYAFRDNFMWRIEARGLTSEDKIFMLNGSPSNQNYFFTAAMAISF
ncbi:MAG: porin [Flavobacteriales bacterium]